MLGSIGMIAGFPAAPATADPPDYSEQGPYDVAAVRVPFDVPEAQKNDLGRTLPLELHLPVASAAPAPLLVFFTGFSLRCSDYKATITHAASWGYATACYNLPRFHHIASATERDIFPSLVTFLRNQSSVEGSPLHGVVDQSSPVLVAGHSRGGKVAGLAFASHPSIATAAWLIDPVDSSQFSPITEEDPSAVEAVRSAKKRVGVVGAGITRPFLGPSCNPPDGNYMKFYETASPGSWQVFVPGASHTTFESAGPIVDAAQDLLCGFGRISRPVAAGLSAVPMLYWFERELRGQMVSESGERASVSGSGNGALPSAFAAWVRDRQAQGLLKFFEKRGVEAHRVELSGSGGSWSNAEEKEEAAVATA
jgi:hypothetical protein